MQERHLDRYRYFNEQSFTTEKYVIPYLQQHVPVNAQVKVLEIGCGEGGNMKPFLEMGCEVIGIDLNVQQMENAAEYLKAYTDKGQLRLITQNIYDIDPASIGSFDIIIMRDVIEHIHDQKKFVGFLRGFLKEKGIVFMGFPPWYMPFGGHQQICKNKLLSKLPYYHILPTFIYKGILKAFGEADKTIADLLEIKETGITLERLKRITKAEKYTLVDETLYLINPNYEIKFGLKLRKQYALFAAIPFFRNFVTTCGYYIFQK